MWEVHTAFAWHAGYNWQQPYHLRLDQGGNDSSDEYHGSDKNTSAGTTGAAVRSANNAAGSGLPKS